MIERERRKQNRIDTNEFICNYIFLIKSINANTKEQDILHIHMNINKKLNY